VHHTEHVLAALYGRGLDNVRIELQQDRVPVVSAGSCAGFWDALAEAGTASQDAPRRVFRLTRAVRQTTALAAPAGAPGVIAAGACRELLAYPAETFSATYVFDVPHLPGMHRGLADYDSGEPFMERVGAARTYVLAVERSSLGAILDVTGRDVIVLTPDSPQPLVDEVARHKLLDLVGDLALLGRPLLARVVALRTGHTAHHDFLRLLTASGALELWPA